jgi:hypothetical protein
MEKNGRGEKKSVEYFKGNKNGIFKKEMLAH